MSDEVRECRDCGAEFDLAEGEKRFYEERGLSLPRRCKACRDRKRAEREEAERPA